MPLSAPPPSWSSIKNKPSTVAGFGITDMSSQSVASAANGGVNSVNGVGGAVSLSALAAYAASIGANGYQKLPSGLIIQWGQAGNSTNGSASFPIAFPNACLSIVATMYSSNQVNVNWELQSKSTTGFSWWIYNGTPILWIAIGY